jgi:hypothetical protein
MKTKLITTILAFCGLLGFAQPTADFSVTRPKNDISISLLGDASLFSFSYERFLIVSPNFLLTGKLGLGYNQEGLPSITFCLSPPCKLGPSERFEKYVTLPHQLTANFGEEKKFLELGIGGTIFSGGYVPYVVVGFRVHPLVSDKLSFRIFVQRRFFLKDTAGIIFIPFGMSFGVAF